MTDEKNTERAKSSTSMLDVLTGKIAKISALITEDPATFRSLKAPTKRVCAPNVPIPYSPVMEQFCLPDKNQVVVAIREVLGQGS